MISKKYLQYCLFTILMFFPSVVFASNGLFTQEFIVSLVWSEIFYITIVIYMKQFVGSDKKLYWLFSLLGLFLMIILAYLIGYVIIFITFFAIIIASVVDTIVKTNMDNKNNAMALNNATNDAGEENKRVFVLPRSFGKLYEGTENDTLEKFIIKELSKTNFDIKTKLIPIDVLKRKKILNIIFSILIFVYLTMVFFHFPILTYIFGLFILIIFFCLTRRFTFLKYLKKQIKARPSEKISNIIMYEKNGLVDDNSKGILLIGLLIAVVIPLISFATPKIFYEKTDGGYAVRYYAYGITNFKSVTIPAEHNGEKVVSLRGNTFSNMFLLESVSLSDTIVEIRGQAFKNCFKLNEISLPSNLEYLGGGAFYNAKSLRSIELPDSLTYLGGESFYGASSLYSVKLSENITEIRGDSFEYCTGLVSIKIPDGVTRIGGHAFYGDYNLSEVIISENSKLIEIGSSAFRECSRLYSITIPYGTYVNERAFKDSPTRVNLYDKKY